MTAAEKAMALEAERAAERLEAQGRLEAWLEARRRRDAIAFQQVMSRAEAAVARRRLAMMGAGVHGWLAGFAIGARTAR